MYLTLVRPSKIGQGGEKVLHLVAHPPRLKLLQLHQHQALPIVLWEDPDYFPPCQIVFSEVFLVSLILMNFRLRKGIKNLD